jgi:hypothetical protein
MKKVLIVGLLISLGGCAAPPTVVTQVSRQSASEPAAVEVEEVDVVTPIYIAAQPDYVFYNRWYGPCACFMIVREYQGVWYDHRGVVRHHGAWHHAHYGRPTPAGARMHHSYLRDNHQHFSRTPYRAPRPAAAEHHRPTMPHAQAPAQQPARSYAGQPQQSQPAQKTAPATGTRTTQPAQPRPPALKQHPPQAQQVRQAPPPQKTIQKTAPKNTNCSNGKCT